MGGRSRTIPVGTPPIEFQSSQLGSRSDNKKGGPLPPPACVHTGSVSMAFKKIKHYRNQIAESAQMPGVNPDYFCPHNSTQSTAATPPTRSCLQRSRADVFSSTEWNFSFSRNWLHLHLERSFTAASTTGDRWRRFIAAITAPKNWGCTKPPFKAMVFAVNHPAG